MRIAYYAPLNAPIDGVPSGDRRVAQLYVQALRASGHAVELVSTFSSFDAAGDVQRQESLREQGRAIAASLVQRWGSAAADQRPQLWLTYHLYYKAPDWLGPSVSRHLDIAYVVAEPSHAPKRAQGAWALGHAACEAAIRAARMLLCPSRDDIGALASVLGSAERIVRLPPFLDPSLFASARQARVAARKQLAAERGLDSQVPWILAVAMMRPGDKLASYRALATTLCRLLDRPWRLIVAGDGPARAEVEAALHGALPSRSCFLGELGQAELARVYGACDLLVWPAINEAYGMALLEAQAAGLPVVAANLRGVPDVVKDGTTGLLAPAGDQRTLAALVSELLDAPERRRQMGEAAFRFVVDERGVDVAARRLTQLLDPLLSGGYVS